MHLKTGMGDRKEFLHMQDAEVMNQLGELITEWDVVDEQLIPGRFDILLRCSPPN